jgi:hypothetical protein
VVDPQIETIARAEYVAAFHKYRADITTPQTLKALFE